MNFKAFYDSDLQVTYLTLVVPLVFLAWFFMSPRRTAVLAPASTGFLRGFLLVALALSVVDAFFAGPLLTWLGSTDGNVKLGFAIFFVVLGDFRHFALCFEVARTDSSRARAMLSAAVVSFAAPVLFLGLGLYRQTHGLGVDASWFFRWYEFTLVGVLLLVRLALQRRLANDSSDRWPAVANLVDFGVLYYALWLGADLFILAGHEWAWLLRVVPNQLYYALLIPFAYWRLFVRGAPASDSARA